MGLINPIKKKTLTVMMTCTGFRQQDVYAVKVLRGI